MKKLSLNIKKIALSLLVVGLAVGFSAFKNANRVVGDYYVQRTADSYSFVAHGSYNDLGCEPLDDKICTYQQTGTPLIGTLPLNPTEIQDNIDNNRIVALTGAGLYTAP